MKRMLGRLACAIALLASTSALAQNTAYAGPGAIAVALEGSGTITPGLTATMTNQAGSFDGTVGLVGASGAGVSVNLGSCHITFTSTLAEIFAYGLGMASGNCQGSGLLGSDTVTCVKMTYVRVGVWVSIHVALSGCSQFTSGVLGSDVASTAVSETWALVVPTHGDGFTTPITAYDLVAAGVFAGS